MITSRQEVLLASIIKEYIEAAEPISSKWLEKMGFFDLSSATIRAEMNELEKLGYLAQLYTSSGRVPTDRAYRFYVDNLNPNHRNAEEPQKHRNNTKTQRRGLEVLEIKEKDKNRIRFAIREAGEEPREINRVVAQTLSDLSDNLVITGIVEEDDFYKIGLSNLFEMPEFREFNRAFRLASFFDEFESLFERIEKEFFSFGGNRIQPRDEVRVFIGRENPIKNIRDETVMFAKYNLPHDMTGSLILVGPTRMDYAKNIGLIKYATRELNKFSRKA